MKATSIVPVTVNLGAGGEEGGILNKEYESKWDIYYIICTVQQYSEASKKKKPRAHGYGN